MSNFIYPCDPALFKVAGVDEVGRGPLVGDVVTAAVILDPAKPIIGLADSKSSPRSGGLPFTTRFARTPWLLPSDAVHPLKLMH